MPETSVIDQAVGLGSVWVVAQDAGKLVRVDPATSAVAGTADIGVGARLVTSGGGAVWVSHYANGTVLRVEQEVVEGAALEQGVVVVASHGRRSSAS